MLRNLLSPIKARFDVPTRPGTLQPPITPRSSDGRMIYPDGGYFDLDSNAMEDFARDVMIELMGNAVETLKTADDVKARAEVLSEMHRILIQDPRTKDVFRELDGFLVLMSVLSTVQEQPTSGSSPGSTKSSPTIVLNEGSGEQQQVLVDVVESTRLAFIVLSEAMYKHPQNAEWFRTRIGYEFLSHATLSLISDSQTTTETLGLLLSLSLHDFSCSPFFTRLRTNCHSPPQDGADPVSATINCYEGQFQCASICVPGALLILWNAIASLSTEDAQYMRCSMFWILELLSHVSHRNHSLLCSLGLVGPVFKRFYEDASTGKEERQLLQKLLKRLLEMGADTGEVRNLFHKTLNAEGVDGMTGGKLDVEVLDLLKAGMKSRWTEHLSLEGTSALVFTEESMKGLPSSGFTFMLWIWLSDLPIQRPFTLFNVKLDSSNLIELKLNEDGILTLSTAVNPDPVPLTQSKIAKSHWTHIMLVHYPHRSSKPTIRLFMNGTLAGTIQSAYPKPGAPSLGQYRLGDESSSTQLSWCLSSAYFLSVPLEDEISRLIYHLGPRYSGTFRDPFLVKFLTYEASTSLNMYLYNISKPKPDNRSSSKFKPVDSPLIKVLKDGLGISESQYIFALSAKHNVMVQKDQGQALTKSTRMPDEAFLQNVLTIIPSPVDHINDEEQNKGKFKVMGDVVLVKSMCLDQALWKIGGPAAALRLVQAAYTSHELSRALSVLLEGIKSNWQNSEDMERLRGYDILAGILRTKANLVNLTCFETIFEFLGINFRSPEYSTVVSVLSYRSIALDFELWSHSHKEIQRVHLEHFTTLLINSRYKKFNMRQRLAKLGVVRQLLFVLQMDWYCGEAIPWVVNALYAVCQADFSRDTIKPVVSYLAANLHGDAPQVESPSFNITRIDLKDRRGKAEQVLVSFLSLLFIPKFHSRFTAVLPLTRICLLLLGEHPTSLVAEQILNLIGVSIRLSNSFIRKFELVSGWNVLKTVIPRCWDAKVHRAAFDILTDQSSGSGKLERTDPSHDTNWCTYIIPTILCSLQAGLVSVTERCVLTYKSDDDQDLWVPEFTMEALVEELLSLHTASAAFRQVFASQQTTQIFVNTYKTFVTSVSGASAVNNDLTIRLLEKLTHFSLALALDNAVAGSFKREIIDTLEVAETIINPSGGKPTIDRNLVVDTRTLRQRVTSAKWSLQVEERIVNKTMTRMAEWRKVVCESERKRLRKDVQDLREYRRQVPHLQEWTMTLVSERGLWPRCHHRTWRLDETEGPHRIRKKMEPADDPVVQSTRVDLGRDEKEIQMSDDGSRTPDQAAVVPPWTESYEITATDIEEHQLADDIVEDKHRRVRHELEPGDVIEAVQTVARISGVDSSPGLFIIGKTHVYMLDGLVENEEDEVIDAHDAQKQLFFVPGSIVELDGPQRAQRWSHSQIVGFSDKRFLFRDVALEIYFKDSRSLLIVFLDQKRRTEFNNRLTAIIAHSSPEQLINPSILKSPLMKIGQRVLPGLKNDELATAQRKWQAREISNFTYLSILNQISGRTPSDATQYPVFPWVLQDYTSQTLDFTLPSTYRDLTKPMGALNAERRDAAELRYNSLKSVNEEPFHYGTHFSSSMVVCHFLIRMAPYTHMFKTLQGGDWDLPDRLFSDLGRAYQSAAVDVRGDVRELIPEFFTCPEFLENSANLDFGVLSSTGERIHDVKLPPWAREDPLLFVILNRRALESSQVSENLPQWIDLIWGYKQRDPESLNVFQPLSYEGSIDLDTIQDDLQREATVGIIHNFGQTPRKLFTTPHPQRFNHVLSTLPVGILHGIEEDPHLLTQASRCFKDFGANVPVHDFVLDGFTEKVIPCPPNTLYVPQYTHDYIEWSSATSELRLFADNRLVQVVEDAFCTCAAFANSTNLVTGCSDYTVRMWKVTRVQQNQHTRMHLTHIMRIHTDEVICVTVCQTWSLIVSGSRDGSAALWDLNKGIFVRSIWHGGASDANAVRLVAINESTGYIATCSDSKLCLHTINARHITTLDLISPPVYATVTAPITSLAFHERDYSHLGILATGASDGSITLRTWTADGTPEGEKAQWEFVTVRTMKVRNGRGALRPPAISALKFLGESLVHGEETGKSFVWNLPD